MRLARSILTWIGIISAALIALAIALPSVIRVAESGHLYTTTDDVPASPVGIVLGASIVRGQQSPVLEARTDEAIELYHKAKIGKILVTGDGRTEDYNEVEPVHDYLLKAGVPERDIILDYHGLDTYQSMERAHAIFGVTKATILTQDFHIPRAVFLARSVGIDAVGVSVDDRESLVFNYLREIPACIKAVWEVALYSIAQYI